MVVNTLEGGLLIQSPWSGCKEPHHQVMMVSDSPNRRETKSAAGGAPQYHPFTTLCNHAAWTFQWSAKHSPRGLAINHDDLYHPHDDAHGRRSASSTPDLRSDDHGPHSQPQLTDLDRPRIPARPTAHHGSGHAPQGRLRPRPVQGASPRPRGRITPSKEAGIGVVRVTRGAKTFAAQPPRQGLPSRRSTTRNGRHHGLRLVQAHRRHARDEVRLHSPSCTPRNRYSSIDSRTASIHIHGPGRAGIPMGPSPVDGCITSKV